MAFSTAPLLLNVPVKRKGNLFLFESITLLVKYLHIPPLERTRPTSKSEQDGAPASDATTMAATSAASADSRAVVAAAAAHKPPKTKPFTFEVRRVERQDGHHECGPEGNALPARFWQTEDAGEWPYDREKRVEQRLVAVTFKGRELSDELAKMSDGRNAALFEAFLEQGCLHVSVRVNGQIEVPLVLKVGVVVLPA